MMLWIKQHVTNKSYGDNYHKDVMIIDEIVITCDQIKGLENKYST